ncbi:MAG: hypothetical protein IPK13_16320 [Deltaproteobacteria bacterium]|nr:hypothetical protein [Deltaproteobacteria bacterium]
MAYRPDQRAVTCSILTTGGWCEGTLHVPRASFLVDQLNVGNHELLKLTDFRFLTRDIRHEFFALQRDGVALVIPPDNETQIVAAPEDNAISASVTCWFGFGVVMGRVRMRRGVRTSDFWVRQAGFVVLEDCKVRLADDLEQLCAAVIVNTKQMIGLSEESSPR